MPDENNNSFKHALDQLIIDPMRIEIQAEIDANFIRLLDRLLDIEETEKQKFKQMGCWFRSKTRA